MIVELEEAIQLLLNQRVVALPTETVYGLGGLAQSSEAIKRIYQAKGRPQDNPLICHFFNAAQITPYVSMTPAYWGCLVNAFSPGPVSYRLPLPARSPLTPSVAGQSTVACRIPDQPLCLEVIRQIGQPIAAPSANTSGKVSPTTAQMVNQDLGPKIAGVLDGGPCSYGLESTILDCCEEDKIIILRPGSVGPEEIRKTLDEQGFHNVEVSYLTAPRSDVIPGNKYRHYAPDTALSSIQRLSEIPIEAPGIVLASQERINETPWPSHLHTLSLGSRHNLPDVAKHLYQRLKSLDELPEVVAYYWVEPWGESSLGRAITNRLRRASQKNPTKTDK